jgi:hypothetical protein
MGERCDCDEAREAVQRTGDATTCARCGRESRPVFLGDELAGVARDLHASRLPPAAGRERDPMTYTTTIDPNREITPDERAEARQRDADATQREIARQASRQARALERIAAALERLAGVEEPHCRCEHPGGSHGAQGCRACGCNWRGGDGSDAADRGMLR